MFTKTFSASIGFLLINIFVHNISLAQSVRTEYEIRLVKASDRTKYIVLSAPADLSGVVEFKLPPVPGTVGQVLTINNEGKMEWATFSTSPSPVVSPFPVGTIMLFGGDSIPDGWMLCDGRLITDTVTYKELIKIIGKKYGNGSECRVPNMQGKFPLGKDGVRDLGASGGEESVQLNESNLPAHNHLMIMSDEGTQGPYNTLVPLSSPPAYRTYLNVAPSNSASFYKQKPANGLPLAAEAISKTGGGIAHNNMPPYIVVNYIIKY